MKKELEEVTSMPTVVEITASKNAKSDKKPAYEFICKGVFDECGLAMAAGAVKYGSYNFFKGHDRNELLAAAIRHLMDEMMGNRYDDDTSNRLGRKVRHLGCALANINMILTQEELGTIKDARGDAIKQLNEMLGKNKT